MALLRIARSLIFAAGLCAPGVLLGEDIDLFKGGTPITGQKPNVLIIVDNTVNWNNNANHWPGGKQAQEELESLSTVVGSLTGDVRVGLMMIKDSAGYLRFSLRDMDSTNRTAFQQMLTGMAANTGDNDVPTSQGDYGALMYEAWKYFSGKTNAAITSNQRDYTGNGSVNVSPYTAGNITGSALANSTSTTYINPLSTTQPCNKNFIIFIGNGFPSTSSTDPNTLSVTNWTSSHSTQIYDEGTKTTYLDEWARFLHTIGAANKPCDTSVSPNICADNLITTYTIDVYKDHIDTPQTNLLKSTASVGGGKYFAATSKEQIEAALTRIISEIQAVNSVFTSASLPVSVNTQGTFLNQIYMGVFRPDNTGAPRWQGNLKQYKFTLTTDASGTEGISLADADGALAVNTNTGFIDPSARSYWSKSVTPSAGFWAFSPSGVGGQYDAPDGELVEKGGAAQKLRDLGPTSRTVYTCTPDCTTGTTPSLFNSANTDLLTALAGTTSPVTSLTRAGLLVSVTTSADLSLASPTDSVAISGASVAGYNSSWTATKVDGFNFTFPITETPATPATGSAITVESGTSVSQSISTAGAVVYNSSGTYQGFVSVNLPSHGFVDGQSVTMDGAAVSSSMSTATTKCTSRNLATPTDATCEYNGTFSIVYVDANNFRYLPPTTNFGTTSTASGTTTTYNPVDGTITPGTATITCSAAGSAASNTGTVTVSAVTKATQSTTGSMQIKVTLASVPSSCSNEVRVGGSGNNGRITAFSITGTGSTVLDGVAQTVSSLGVGSSCTTGTANSSTLVVCFNATVTSTTTTNFSSTTIIPASPATGTITATGIPTRVVTSITRTDGDASNVATVTVTTAVNHGFGAATSVTVRGADQTEYNGTRTTANTVGNQLAIASGSNTLTFTINTGPTSPATGATAAKGSSIDPATLVNWVRGVDNKEDENVNASLTDCRASIHGDVLHSRPLVINYGDTTGIYAFYGANDGTFRGTKVGQDEATGSTDGQESWSFVAPEHYSTLGRLYNNTPLIKYVGDSSPRTARNYFFDGNIGVFQTADFATTHIFVGMRRGGRFIYALDVSTPTAPKFLWKKSSSDSGFSEMGQTWSEPRVAILKKTPGVACNPADSSTYVRALIFGAGYDSASDDTATTSPLTSAPVRPTHTMGRGVFVLNAADGSLIKLLQPPANDYAGRSNSSRRYSIPSDVTLLDTDSDGCVDRMYVGDTGAKIHRFDVGDVVASSDMTTYSGNWKAYTIATLGDEGNNGGSNDRRILYPPEVVLSGSGSSLVAYVLVGTGDREQPSSTTINDRFYMIKDSIAAGTAVASSTATTQAVRESALTQVTDFNNSTSTIDPTLSSFKGWYITYESGEKSVNAALTASGKTFFGTNKPKAVDPRSCEPNLGTARGYAVNFLNGTSAVGDRTGDGTISRADLYSTFTGGGLPPSPVSGVVTIDGKTVRFVIGSGGTGTTGEAIQGTKLSAAPAGARKRVYWYFKKDD